MHAVVTEVNIDPSGADAALEFLETKNVPTMRQLPGFVSGTWTKSSDSTEGRSMIVFETKEAADGAADLIRGAARPDPITLVSLGVYEVVAQA